MIKVFWAWLRKSISRLILITFSLLFLFACARVQPVQQSAPTAEPTVEEVKKETKQDRPVSPDPPPVKTTPTPTPPSEPPRTPKPPPPPAPAPPPSRMTKVVWDSVNLREGPGTNHKVIGTVKKGASLAVFEAKGNWLHVRLEDGREAWVIRSATSESTPPAPPSVPPKPKPM